MTVTLQFQFRKSKVEIDSLIKKTDLYELAKKQLCFEEDSTALSEYLYDKDKKWKEVPSTEELTLEEGTKLKWKKRIPVNINYTLSMINSRTSEIRTTSMKKKKQFKMYHLVYPNLQDKDSLLARDSRLDPNMSFIQK